MAEAVVPKPEAVVGVSGCCQYDAVLPRHWLVPSECGEMSPLIEVSARGQIVPTGFEIEKSAKGG